MSYRIGPWTTNVYFLKDWLAEVKQSLPWDQHTLLQHICALSSLLTPTHLSPLQCCCLFSPEDKCVRGSVQSWHLVSPSYLIKQSAKDRVQLTPTIHTNGTRWNVYPMWSTTPGPQQVVTRLWCMVNAVIYIVIIIIITITLIVISP